MENSLIFNNIVLNSSHAVFSKSIVGALINPDWSSKNISFSEQFLGDITFEEMRKAGIGANREDYSLVGCISMSYQIFNGGISQYLFNNYNRDYSSTDHLIDYLTSELLPFSMELFGVDDTHTIGLKNVIRALDILETVLEEQLLDEEGNFVVQESESCCECDGEGIVKDLDDEENEEDCSFCDGTGRQYWDATYSYDFDSVVSHKHNVAGFGLNEFFWDNLPSLEILVELRCEYLVKSLELNQERVEIGF